MANHWCDYKTDKIIINEGFPYYAYETYLAKGKVVAEFTLKRIDTIEICDPDILINGKQCKQANLQKECQVNIDGIMSYIGYGNDHDGWGRDWDKGYLWHIEDLKIYDKPRELSDFRKDLDCDDYPCNKGGKGSDCKYCYYDISEGCQACRIDFDGEHCIYKTIKRPPQSWCYVTGERRVGLNE